MGFEYFKWTTHHISERVLLSFRSHGKRVAHARRFLAYCAVFVSTGASIKVTNYSKSIPWLPGQHPGVNLGELGSVNLGSPVISYQ